MAGIRVRFVVSGRVQGVCYRASVREKAESLGIEGWVRNLADGCVELVAAGEAIAIEDLAAWLWEGPPAASVSSVAVSDWDGELGAGFAIVRDGS